MWLVWLKHEAGVWWDLWVGEHTDPRGTMIALCDRATDGAFS